MRKCSANSCAERPASRWLARTVRRRRRVLLAAILTEAKLDPTIVIGGKVDALGGNAKYGKGELVLAEADESDGSFSHLPATYSIVTNIDSDHLDHFADLAAIDEAFVGFLGQTPFYGSAVLCGDDPGIRRCLPRFSRPYVTYGFALDNDYRLESFTEGPGELKFSLRTRSGELIGDFKVKTQGRHNALNSAAAILLAHRLGVNLDAARTALANFGGVRRRFDLRHRDSVAQIEIRDDYGHHPTEIAATLQAARAYWPHGRVLVAFQPHRYSRTKHCLEGFTTCFAGVNAVFLTDIYAAGEDPIAGVDSELLTRSIGTSAHAPENAFYTGNLEKTADAILAHARPGDLILTMGAGSVTRLPDLLIERLARVGKTA